MSSKEKDPHAICVECRGVDCDQEKRCDMCNDWDSAKMSNYLSHRRSLVNKRLSKKRKREREAENLGKVADFVDICTGVQETPVVLSDECGSHEEAIAESASSAASLNVRKLVGEVFHSFSIKFSAELNQKLEIFAEQVLKSVNSYNSNTTNKIQLRHNFC